MIYYLVILLLGVATGTLTGLLPGLHPNTIVFSTLPFYFSTEVDYIVYSSFIAGLSVSHTFHDFLPAIFIGAPEAESALASLPGADMAAEGRGLEAFGYTVNGGAVSIAVFVASVPFLLLFLESLYSSLELVLPPLVLFFLFFAVFSSGSGHAALVALLSGIFGLLAFRMPVNQNFVLLPVFSGLFAIPAIFRALESDFNFPEQQGYRIRESVAVRGGLVGYLSGLLSGVLPGVGPAISTTFVSPLLEESEKEFLAGMGAVNTSDILVSFTALLLIGKARSGAAVALQKITAPGYVDSVFLLGASLVAAGISIPLAFLTGRRIAEFLPGLPVKAILMAVLLSILLLTGVLTGLPGFLVLGTGTFIGYSSVLVSSRRACMAVLMLPFLVSSGGFI